jgi:hypothetical protein
MVPRSGLWAMLREKHLLINHRAALWVRWLILFPLWQLEPQASRLRNCYAMDREKHCREFKCAVDRGQHEALPDLQKTDWEKLRVQPHEMRHLQAWVLLDVPGAMVRAWVVIWRLLQVQQIRWASKRRESQEGSLEGLRCEECAVEIHFLLRTVQQPWKSRKPREKLATQHWRENRTFAQN